MAATEPSVREMLEHAWQYFSLHANQRISLFNFFLVVSTSVGAALAASFQRGGIFYVLGLGLGCLLVLMSFTFWKLDQRTSALVKHGEDAIIELEALLPATAARLVSRESDRTAGLEKGFVLTRMWTYGRAFRVVFSTMGIVGATGAVLSWAGWCGWI